MTQMKERSIQTLGYLPVGDGDFPHQKKLLQGLMDSVEVGSMSSCSTEPRKGRNYFDGYYVKVTMFFLYNSLRNNISELLKKNWYSAYC